MNPEHLNCPLDATLIGKQRGKEAAGAAQAGESAGGQEPRFGRMADGPREPVLEKHWMTREQASLLNVDPDATIAIRQDSMFATFGIGRDGKPVIKTSGVKSIGMIGMGRQRGNAQNVPVDARVPDQAGIRRRAGRILGENENSRSADRPSRHDRASPCWPRCTKQHSRDRAGATPTSCPRGRYREAAGRAQGRANRVEAPAATITLPCDATREKTNGL